MTAKPVSAEELIALNDEIASLVRAGVPLEVGLEGFGESLSGRLRELIEPLVDRMKAGASLSEALASRADRLPTVYRTIVEAGLKAGRLPEALESMTAFARSLLELRRLMILALIYPCSVLFVAYGLFVGFVVALVPQFDELYRSFRLPIHYWMPAMQFLNRTVHIWGPGIPALLVLYLLFSGIPRRRPPERRLVSQAEINVVSDCPSDSCGRRHIPAGRPSALASAGVLERRGVARLPWMKPILANFHRSNFAEMLAILVRHEVPLHEALLLAAGTTGDALIVAAGAKMADEVQAGRSLSESLRSRVDFPPFMRWMICSGAEQGALESSLRQVAEIYRRRAFFQAQCVKVVLPVLLTLFVGGGTVLIYALTLFVPMTDLLKDIVS